MNGFPCNGDLGYCYNGQCPQRPDQCVRMYGSGECPRFMSSYLMRMVLKLLFWCHQVRHKPRSTAITTTPEEPTSPSANALWTSSHPASRSESQQISPACVGLVLWTQGEPLISCRDVMCGKLFCQNGQENPNYGRMVTVNGCKAAFFDDYTKDYGQVDSGTKCGDGKVTGCQLLSGHPRPSVTVCIRVSSAFVFFSRCAARTSVWIWRRLTETQTARPNVPATL